MKDLNCCKKNNHFLDKKTVTPYNQFVKRKNLVLLLCLISFCLSFVGIVAGPERFSFAHIEKIRIIYDWAPVYADANFLQMSNQERENSLIERVKLHQVYEVVEELEDMYKIKMETRQGYILKSMAINDNISSPAKVLNYNAEIIADCKCFDKYSERFTPNDYELNRGDKVCILDGYDTSKEYTLVSFYKNQTLVNCYIKTEVLKVDGINARVITLVSVLIALSTISVIMIGLFVGKKKKIKM